MAEILNNKLSTAFPSPEPTKPVSPYGAYNGQLRSGVYQPTEIALIAKGLTKVGVHTISEFPLLSQLK